MGAGSTDAIFAAISCLFLGIASSLMADSSSPLQIAGGILSCLFGMQISFSKQAAKGPNLKRRGYRGPISVHVLSHLDKSRFGFCSSWLHSRVQGAFDIIQKRVWVAR